jgi:hypothetical protein
MARLSMAKRGGFAPINFPLFKGSRREVCRVRSVRSRIMVLLCCRGTSECVRRDNRMTVGLWINFGYGMHTSWFGAWQVGVSGASRGAPFGAQARRLHKVDCAGRREHDAVISASRLG